jgi:N-acetylglucosaminyldiphosphoundecaprenol N-acetyl-beta-D-mannosaminyltransferase
MNKARVIRTQIDVTDYEQAISTIDFWAQGSEVRLVAAANTHLVGEAAFNPEFEAHLACFDLIVPDGMPLVWVMRLDGHSIEDRVYGPHLMKRALEQLSAGCRHAFVGGSPECHEKLLPAAAKLNSSINLAGAISPPFRQWSEEDNLQLIQQIKDLNANIVWLALGGVKQETWLAKHRHLLPPAVYLAVGDAFVLVAGMRRYAPGWMQRCGLTWLFRLMQEPKRLAGRYLKYNLRFVLAFMLDRWQRFLNA